MTSVQQFEVWYIFNSILTCTLFPLILISFYFIVRSFHWSLFLVLPLTYLLRLFLYPWIFSFPPRFYTFSRLLSFFFKYIFRGFILLLIFISISLLPSPSYCIVSHLLSRFFCSFIYTFPFSIRSLCSVSLLLLRNSCGFEDSAFLSFLTSLFCLSLACWRSSLSWESV